MQKMKDVTEKFYKLSTKKEKQINKGIKIFLYASILLLLSEGTLISRCNAEQPVHGKFINVVCIARNVSTNHIIEFDNLKLKSIPASEKPLHAIPEVLIAYKRKAHKNFHAGEILTLENLGIPHYAWSNDQSFVLYAKADIPSGHILTISDVVEKQWKGASYPQGGFANPGIILGRKALGGIQQGQLLLVSAFGLGARRISAASIAIKSN